MTVYAYSVLVEDTVRKIKKTMRILAENEQVAKERAKYSQHSDMLIDRVTVLGKTI